MPPPRSSGESPKRESYVMASTIPFAGEQVKRRMRPSARISGGAWIEVNNPPARADIVSVSARGVR
jgi:hypothetical protein